MSNRVRLVEKATGKIWEIPSEQFDEAWASGLYDLPEGDQTVVRMGPQGAVEQSASDVVAAPAGSPLVNPGISPEDAAELERKGELESRHGGLGGRVKTARDAVFDTLSLGAYSATMRAIDPEGEGRDIRERAETNPGTRTGFEIASVVVPGMGIGKIGQGLREFTPLGRVVKRSDKLIDSGRRLRGYVEEGVVIGAADGVNEVVMSEDPVTVERIASSVGSHLVSGVGMGVGIAGVHNIASRAWARTLAKRAEAPKAPDGVSDDLATMSKQDLRKAHTAEKQRLNAELNDAKDAEIERIHNEDVRAMGEDIVARADEYSADKRLLKLTGDDEAESFAEYRPYGKVYNKARNQVVKALDNRVGLADNPNKLLDPLQREAQVIDNILGDADKFAEEIVKQNARMVRKIDSLKGMGEHTLKGDMLRKYGDFAGIPVKNKRAREGMVVQAEDVARFRQSLESGEFTARQMEILEDLKIMRQQNQALQDSIKARKAAYKKPSSPRLRELEAKEVRSDRLDQIEDALAAADKPRGVIGSLVDKAAGMVPGGRLMLNAVNRRAGNAANEVAERSFKAAESAVKAARKGAPSLIPLASKVLKDTQFGPEAPKKKPKTLREAYEAREAEIRQQVMLGPEGPVVTPAAREAIAKNLDGVRSVDPVLADRLETVAARQIEFLAAKLPKVPESQLKFGRPIAEVADMNRRKWARYVAAVVDPGGVEERVARGTVSPEDVEAMRAVYPGRYEAFKDMLLEQLTEMQESLPLQNRVALSLYTGEAIDPAMQPQILTILQGNYAEEPGTEGGMMAPQPQPQFGSVSSPEPTKAQERMK